MRIHQTNGVEQLLLNYYTGHARNPSPAETGLFHDKYLMRIYEITQQDPVFSDPELVKILSYYLTPDVVNSLHTMSPYTPGSGNEQWRSRYDAIVASITPMLKKPNPDIHAIIQVVDKKIPIIGMPKWIKDVVLSADQRYKQAELAYQKNQEDRKNWRSTGDKQVDNWVIVDEPPEAMPVPFKP